MVTRIIPLLVLDLNELHRCQQENVVQFNDTVESCMCAIEMRDFSSCVISQLVLAAVSEILPH